MLILNTPEQIFKNSGPKSTVDVIKDVNLQPHRVYSAGFIWKNRQLTTNIYINEFEIFLHQTRKKEEKILHVIFNKLKHISNYF